MPSMGRSECTSRPWMTALTVFCLVPRPASYSGSATVRTHSGYVPESVESWLIFLRANDDRWLAGSGTRVLGGLCEKWYDLAAVTPFSAPPRVNVARNEFVLCIHGSSMVELA